jgi:Spy/CpxP family protein refolding chaperone
MERTARAFARTTLIAVCLALGVASTSPAQGHGGGGPPPGGGGMGGPGGGGMGGPQFPNGGRPMDRGPMGTPEPRPGQRNQIPGQALQLGPPGQRWWDDKSMVKSLKLRPDQQAHMDAIFEQNRAALLTRLQGVQQAETQMDELAKAPTLDEGALFAQIDRVAQARADLEKATTHLLLQIRKEMDPDQIKRLQKGSQR